MSIFNTCVCYHDGTSLTPIIGSTNFTMTGATWNPSTNDRFNCNKLLHNYSAGTPEYLIGTNIMSANIKSGFIWIYPTTIVGSKTILSVFNSVTDIIRTSSTTEITSALTTPTTYVNGVSGSTIGTNNWYFIGATSATAVSSQISVYINNGNAYGINAVYGEMFLFSNELSASEVKSLYDITSKKYIYPYQCGERGYDDS